RPPKVHILDLCCGTGQLAQALITRGYRVTGLDGSAQMLRFARENTPMGEFTLDDARSFELSTICHGVISTFDSLNHIMSLEEMTSVFRNVYAVLAEGGLFLFDLNMEEGYKSRWRGSFNIVEDDHVCVVRASYYPEERLGKNDITMFHLENGWIRSDLTLVQKCYSESEIWSALEVVGFTDVDTYDAQRDLELTESIGRSFFVCHKPGRINAG
ncbi:MAG: class I SAM-dependent DNA methyltransferase, partial [Dehalococcoidia bacterium]